MQPMDAILRTLSRERKWFSAYSLKNKYERGGVNQ